MHYNPNLSNIIFDLDGTLVDTAPDLSHALNKVLASIDRPPFSADDVRHMVGGGARALIIHSLKATGGILPDADINRLHQMYLDHYSNNIAVDSRPFEGCETLLKTLAEKNITMGIATNKPEYLAKKLVSELGLSHYFKSIKGWDQVTNPKPHKDHLLETMAEMGARPNNCIMVGDSETDQKAALNAGIPVVLVTFGYTTIPVRELKADYYIDNLNELSALFFN